MYGDSATLEAACQTISTRADLAAASFFAAQATFALILSPYFYQRWRYGSVDVMLITKLSIMFDADHRNSLFAR